MKQNWNYYSDTSYILAVTDFTTLSRGLIPCNIGMPESEQVRAMTKKTLLQDLVIEHIPTGAQREVMLIQIAEDADHWHGNVILHCRDGHKVSMSLLGLVQLMMGGTIQHDSLRMYLSRHEDLTTLKKRREERETMNVYEMTLKEFLKSEEKSIIYDMEPLNTIELIDGVYTARYIRRLLDEA